MPRSWGEFQILAQLGSGSSATVYRARAADGREVALKVARDSLEPDETRRFLREGELASTLEHPGLVRVEGWGEVEGVPYVALELTPGAQPLDRAWADWELSRRVDAVRQAADALGAAHAQGLVHRDLKPANLLVDPDGRVRITDFGLSWHAGLDSLTQSRALLGTPLYMAPEVWSAPGKASRRQPAMDVWSLGVLLYEALTGQHPYGSPGETQVAILRRLQRPLRRPRELTSGLPAAWEATCLRALERDPTRRFADARDFARALGEEPPVAPGRRLWRGLAPLGIALLLGALLWLRPATLGPLPPPPPTRTPTSLASSPTPSPTATRSPPATRSPDPEPKSTQPIAAAPRGTLVAEPNPVLVAPASIGETSIAWTTSGCQRTPSVWVSEASKPTAKPKLFSSGVRGRDPAAWIVLGRRYTFRLHAGPDPSFPLLDELVVTARTR
ncbi:MAG: protein kinase [Planctomycetes bacterium]|nr:protein kinase [Planctomycetota bacterium]